MIVENNIDKINPYEIVVVDIKGDISIKDAFLTITIPSSSNEEASAVWSEVKREILKKDTLISEEFTFLSANIIEIGDTVNIVPTFKSVRKVSGSRIPEITSSVSECLDSEIKLDDFVDYEFTISGEA